VARPLCFKVDSTESASMPQAAKARMGRMFGAMVSYEFELPTWRTPSGQLWQPGQFITLTAPGAMVYQPTLLMLRSVVLRQSSGARSAAFNAVLPGSYSGEVPTVLPWA
jgi:prophage tail gpP-like protein